MRAARLHKPVSTLLTVRVTHGRMLKRNARLTIMSSYAQRQISTVKSLLLHLVMSDTSLLPLVECPDALRVLALQQFCRNRHLRDTSTWSSDSFPSCGEVTQLEVHPMEL